MEVIKVKANPENPAEVAREVADAVAASVEKRLRRKQENAEKSNVPESVKLNDEELRALEKTGECQAFFAEVDRRVNELIDFFDTHSGKYGCGIVVATCTLNGADSHRSGMAAAGTGVGVYNALKTVVRNPQTRHMLHGALLSVSLSGITDDSSDDNQAEAGNDDESAPIDGNPAQAEI